MSSTRIFQISLLSVLLVMVVSIPPANGGGTRVYNPTINNLAPTTPVPQEKIVTLCYTLEGYLYSGRHDEYAYMVFTIGERISIKESVGKAGKNRKEDVKLIQKALSNLNLYTGAFNGIVDDKLMNGIERFQREFAGQPSDGRIDVQGSTLAALRTETAEKVFVKLMRTTSHTGHEYALKECVSFRTPSRLGEYEIRYNLIPLIVHYRLGIERKTDISVITEFDISMEREIRRHLLSNPYAMEKLCDLKVVTSGPDVPQPFATFLRVNGKFPSVYGRIQSGHSEDPITMSWYVQPDRKDVEHRFRLYPDQPEWSPWSKVTQTTYYFIGAGTHIFEVASRYRDASGNWTETRMADYRFVLEQPFISKPIITPKAGTETVSSASLPNLDDLYSGSKALIVGVTAFKDSAFGPLPYVNKDVSEMQSVLKKFGFGIDVLEGPVTRNQIIAKIEEMISKARKGDRLVLYFSTHGFDDKIIKSRGYVATYDCQMSEPSVNCIELSYLENLVQRAIQKPVKHLLILLDSCSSGLGVITKSPDYTEIPIAMQNGSHMITAGMADQQAQMDSRLQMSTFTYFVTKGLSGEADYTKDKVISLTELLLYVRYNVAKQSQGSQTPMIGRISGPGEMIFDLR